jgi:acetate kinase
MIPNILVINSGSSSIKYQLLAMPEGRVLVKGLLERIGSGDARLKHWETNASNPTHEKISQVNAPDHQAAFDLVFKALGSAIEFGAIAHRVVHGGSRFSSATRVTDDVIKMIAELGAFAPLHNPINLNGITICHRRFPGIPQVAVFDTAYHHTLPPRAYRYAIPELWYQTFGIRRYGFHGTSHHYVAQKAAAFLGKSLAETSVISLHLGNGASAAAIAKGRCVDTSMGFTPLEGLMMGARSGDIDPAIPSYLQTFHQMEASRIDWQLNHASGLTALTGTNDVRELIIRSQQGEASATLALDMYCYRIKKYIGAYWAVMGGINALIFTGGVGENAPVVRSLVCDGLAHLGIAIDEAANHIQDADICDIAQTGQKTRILVIRTHEELQIAQETWALLN